MVVYLQVFFPAHFTLYSDDYERTINPSINLSLIEHYFILQCTDALQNDFILEF